MILSNFAILGALDGEMISVWLGFGCDKTHCNLEVEIEEGVGLGFRV
jgi:hypothetical protein